MKVTFKSALCIFLSILFVVYLFPASVIAEAPEEWRQKDTDEAITDESAVLDHTNRVDALFELTDLRTEDTKYIRMSDGTYRAVVYKIPVHEKDENGVYQEVDNHLSSVGSDYESAASRVKFAKKVTGNKRIFTLKNGNRKISLALADAQKETPITVANDGAESKTAATKWEELTVLQNSVSSVRYNGILPGTDLEYILLGSTLKENILINEKQDSYVYTFELSLNNLTAELTQDGSIHFITESGEVLYRMPAPYLYDAGGAYSSAASYTLSGSQNGKYTLTLSADSDWINAKDRAFPVTLDPSVVAMGNSSIFDTYQDEQAPSTNYDQAVELCVGDRNEYSQRVILSFLQMPELPTGSMVTNAEVTLKIVRNSVSDTVTRTILMHKITSPSNLSGITCNNEIECTEEAYDYVNINGTATSCSFNITKLYYDEWLKNGTASVCLSMVNNTSTAMNYITFASTENTTSANRPYCIFTYINTLGTEDYFSYRTQSAGDAGTVYIGDYTGQMTLFRTDAVSDNSAQTVSVSHVYNSAISESNYTVLRNDNEINLFAAMKTGKGFMLSTQQSLQPLTIDSTPYCVYTDGDGTSHYLSLFSATEDKITYQDTDGLGLFVKHILKINLFPTWLTNMGFSCLNSLIMEDQSGNCWVFYHGLPTVFCDSNGNLTKYLYNSTSSSGTSWLPNGDGEDILCAIVQNNRKSDTEYYTDIPVAAFTYSDSYLNSITCLGRTLNFVYETVAGGKLLKQITVNETVNINNSYSYTLAEYKYTNGILSDVYDTERQYGIHYTYNNEIEKYTGYYEFAGTIASHTKGSEYQITYEIGKTSYRYLGASTNDTDDIISVSLYDSYGRTITGYTQDVNETIYGATAGSYVNSEDFSNNRIAETSSIGMTGANLLANPSMEKSAGATFSNTWSRSNETKITYNTQVVHSGESSVKMAFNNTNSQSLYIYQNMYALTSGTHCFSVYVNMSEIQAVNPSGGGVTLQVYNTSTGSIVESTLYTGNYAGSNYTPTDPNNEWHRIHVTFSTSAGSRYQLRILGSNMYGSLYVDDAQVEKSSLPGGYNHLSMMSGAAENLGWQFSSNAVSVNTAMPHPLLQAPCVFTVNQNHEPVELYAYQTITNVKGQGFTLSGWAEANAVPDNTKWIFDRYFGLRATVIYEPNEDNTQPEDEVIYVPFNTSIGGLQYACGTIIPRYNEECSIKIEIVYNYNVNSAKFYAVSLVESAAVGYTYNSSGYRIATTKAGLESSTYTYDGANLTSFTSGKLNADITYTEEQNGYLPSTVTTQGITTKYTYDSAGNVTGMVMYPEGRNNAAKIHTASTFDSRRAKLQTSTSELGTVTSYTYNNDGTVKSVTTDGVETEYLYGKKGRQSQIWIDDLASVRYFYDSKGNLYHIDTGGIDSSGSL